MQRTKLKDRKLPTYSKGEEVFNMTTHIVGGGLSIVALVLCIIFASIHGNKYGLITGIVYGITMILLYTMSSIYHGLSPTKETAKKVLQILDHCSIFLLIAGTYTPVALGPIRQADNVAGWTIFAIVWIAAVLGITLNAIDLRKYKVFSMICYLVMGWCIIFRITLLVEAVGVIGTSLIAAGGIVYTIGTIFYRTSEKIKSGCILYFIYSY